MEFTDGGIFGTDYYIKEENQHIGKERSEEKCLGDRLIVRNCHNHGMMLGILKNKDKEFLRDLASMVLGVRSGSIYVLPEKKAHAYPSLGFP